MRIVLTGLSVFFLLHSIAFAEGAPAFVLSTPAPQKIIEEVSYPYTVQTYTSKPSVKNIPYRIQDVYRAPEYVVAEHVLAMHRGDYDVWLSTWDMDERQSLMQIYAQAGKTESYWKNMWAKTLGEYTDFRLSRKVSFGNFLIVEVVATNPAGAMFNVDIPLVRKMKMGVAHYYLTEKLKDHPLRAFWRQNGTRIQHVSATREN